MERIVVVVLVVVMMIPLLLDRPTSETSAEPMRTCRTSETPTGHGAASGGVRLSPTQTGAVRAVLGVAKGMNIARRGAVLAVQAAMQESTLNPAASNGHAVGLFQQIPPGPRNAYVGYDRTDPVAASKGFFTVLTARVPAYRDDPRPNHELAEEVERSGEGFRYEKWQRFAEAVTAAWFDGSGPAMECEDTAPLGGTTPR
jgi:hypothetical protein